MDDELPGLGRDISEHVRALVDCQDADDRCDTRHALRGSGIVVEVLRIDAAEDDVTSPYP